ncbi:MAG: NUDIX hydrolase, partial [Patescibacteria group bacterium]
YEAINIRYQEYYACKFQVPIANTLEETIKNALEMIGEGALRTGGERDVPLYIWRTSHFQNWYQAQKSAGNRLDGAKVEWTFRVGPKRGFVFFWILHVNVYITKENRNKTNEVVISRPDIATIVMYQKKADLYNTDIVLIREFRSPVTTSDGYVWEVPGGSSFKPKGDPLVLAANECEEETGLKIESSRIKKHEARQLVATLSAHKAHLFSVEITDQELDWLRSQQGIAHGVVEDTERTYVEIMKLGEICKQASVDWSMLGMILSVLVHKI